MPNTNWTPAAAAHKANHSVHLLSVVTPGLISRRMLDEIEFRLANFLDFNGGSNDVADVRINWASGIRYAWFNMHGFPGIPSRFLNGNPVPVQIWCNPAGTVFGDTADRHMLIGQRRWSVTRASNRALVVATEAYEWPRGILNWLGMRLLGKSAQLEVWRAYLTNINLELTRAFGSFGAVIISPAEIVPGNPWRPTSTYPHLGGCP